MNLNLNLNPKNPVTAPANSASKSGGAAKAAESSGVSFHAALANKLDFNSQFDEPAFRLRQSADVLETGSTLSASERQSIGQIITDAGLLPSEQADLLRKLQIKIDELSETATSSQMDRMAELMAYVEDLLSGISLEANLIEDTAQIFPELPELLTAPGLELAKTVSPVSYEETPELASYLDELLFADEEIYEFETAPEQLLETLTTEEALPELQSTVSALSDDDLARLRSILQSDESTVAASVSGQNYPIGYQQAYQIVQTVTTISYTELSLTISPFGDTKAQSLQALLSGLASGKDDDKTLFDRMSELLQSILQGGISNLANSTTGNISVTQQQTIATLIGNGDGLSNVDSVLQSIFEQMSAADNSQQVFPEASSLGQLISVNSTKTEWSLRNLVDEMQGATANLRSSVVTDGNELADILAAIAVGNDGQTSGDTTNPLSIFGGGELAELGGELAAAEIGEYDPERPVTIDEELFENEWEYIPQLAETTLANEGAFDESTGNEAESGALANFGAALLTGQNTVQLTAFEERFVAPRVEMQLYEALQNQLPKLTFGQDGKSTFEMTLTPGDLGKIAVTVVSEGGKISIGITADDPRTLAMLAGRAANTEQALKDSGIELLRYTVHAPEDRADYYEQSRQQENSNNGQQSDDEPEEITILDEDDVSISFAELLSSY